MGKRLITAMVPIGIVSIAVALLAIQPWLRDSEGRAMQKRQASSGILTGLDLIEGGSQSAPKSLPSTTSSASTASTLPMAGATLPTTTSPVPSPVLSATPSSDSSAPTSLSDALPLLPQGEPGSSASDAQTKALPLPATDSSVDDTVSITLIPVGGKGFEYPGMDKGNGAMPAPVTEAAAPACATPDAPVCYPYDGITYGMVPVETEWGTEWVHDYSDLDIWLNKIHPCENGGHWHSSTSIFEGGLQFLHSTWVAVRTDDRYATANDAPVDVQIASAKRLTDGRPGGFHNWPVCGRGLY